jgi:hypothetical protein
VVRQFDRRRATFVLEVMGNSTVEPKSSARRQPLVQGLTHERVGEPEPVDPCFFHEARRQGGFDRVDNQAFVGVGRLRHNSDLELATHDGSTLE